jgi:fatty-acyl-CoA synthase
VPESERFSYRAKQGLPVPFVEIRARGGEGLVPWDGATMGELEVRGAWIASAYFEAPDASDRWTPDGWFKTGDIVTIEPNGYIEIQDRSKDLVKSGGEWISTVALENALMGHPAVLEAAVIAVPDEKWSERPLGVVVLREGGEATGDELRAFLAPQFAKWWLPERFEFVAEIPKTAVGKFRKTALREMFAGPAVPAS